MTTRREFKDIFFFRLHFATPLPGVVRRIDSTHVESLYCFFLPSSELLRHHKAGPRELFHRPLKF